MKAWAKIMRGVCIYRYVCINNAESCLKIEKFEEIEVIQLQKATEFFSLSPHSQSPLVSYSLSDFCPFLP